MKFNEKKQKSANTYELTFLIEPEIFNEHLSKIFAKNAKKINAPGFRKGKVPRQVIERLYGKDLFFEEALNSLWPSEFDLALSAAEINNFIAVDKVDVQSISKEDGVQVCVAIITKPDIELGEYKGIEVECEKVNVTDAEINSVINDLALKVARIVPVEGEMCQDKDVVNINFEGFVDSKPLEGGKCENYELTIGNKQFVAGFEEQLIGHKCGEEFKIKVRFPKDYASTQIAGKEAEFVISINKISRPEFPEIDDEFAKDVSDFDTLDALKENIKKGLTAEKERHRNFEIQRKVFDKIIENVAVEIPEIMNQRQVDYFVRDFTDDLKNRGVAITEYLKAMSMSMEELRDKFKKRAERQVKVDLAIEKISELENIQIAEEEIQKEFGIIAERYKIDPQKAQEAMDTENLVLGMKLDKTVDFVIGLAKIKAPSTGSEAKKN